VAETVSRSYAPTPSPPACVTPGSIECFQAALAEQADQGEFAGVVLVAEQWKPLWTGAYGSVAASGVPHGPDSVFPIHSVGKMFTAVAIAQLVESGTLSFEATVDRYLADLQADVGNATIGQLLSHTSGIGDGLLSSGLEHRPGTFNYANQNFELLGLTVEAVTGQSLQAYLDERVFAPSGMQATKTIIDRPLGAPAAADGQQSTVGDLLRFADALFGYQLLSEETTKLITSPQIGTDGGYGYGFMVFSPSDQPTAVGHFGTGPDGAVRAALFVDPSHASAIVILADHGVAAIWAALLEYPRYWPG
jgi:CubicO group peptidase (beta-lactamase class C family)